ncbi:putative membrane protein [Microbacterium sp. SORGH_AS428]|nr:putative membrane protein [Microbacterium sp. SORGH_AS_0428]
MLRTVFASFPASSLSGADPTPPRVRLQRAVTGLLQADALRLAVLALTILLTGLGISIATTTNPQWWRLHFSELGTYGDASAMFFNGTLILGGSTVLLFARAAARQLRPLEGTRVRRGTATTARILFSVVGANLALVGCVPLTTNGFVHDRVAAAMVLGFAGLLLTSPFMMHRFPKRLVLTTGFVFVGLFAGAWVFVTGTINLALFEVIAFSAMFGWSGVFLSALAACAAPAAQTEPVASASASTEPVVAARTPVSDAEPQGATGTGAVEVRTPAAPAASSAHRVPRRSRASRMPVRRRRVAHAGALSHPRRGCRASAARAASAPSTRPVRR